MRGNVERAALADCVDRLLEGLVAERNRSAAAVADEVMVMMAAGQDELEASRAFRQADALEQAEVGEQSEGPVHARGAHPLATLAKAFRDDVGVDAAALVGEQLDHGSASSAGAVTFTAQDVVDEFPPRGTLACRRSGWSLGRWRHQAMIAITKR